MSAALSSRIPDRPADLDLMLPAPPSTNKIWVPVARGKLVQSQAYEAWIKEAGWEVSIQRAAHKRFLAYAMRVSIGTGHDLDNLKALPDLLQKMSVVVNDKDCEELAIRRDRDLKGRKWRVELWKL